MLRKLMDWFPYDNGLRHERVKQISQIAVVFPLLAWVLGMQL